MDSTVLVSNNAHPSGRSPHSVPFRFKNTFPTIQTVKNSPTGSEASTFSSHPIRQSLARFSLPTKIEEVIFAAWEPKTATKYKSFIDRWKLFCIRGSESCYTRSVNSVLKFLYYLYKNGCYYSGLFSARSALSTIVHIERCSKLSDHPLISKFMKGIYNQHPTLPRYVNIWDINALLAYFESLPTNSELTLKCLTEKLTVLLLILSEQQKQTLLAIDIDNVKIYEDKLIILLNSSFKHTKPSRPAQAIVYHKFNGNLKLCVVECAKLYIEVRKELVPPENKQFLVTFGKPHKAASDDTISRWIKNTISSAGIDIYVFKAHSTRSASSSKAIRTGIPYTEILKRDSWKGANTFTKHYDKHIINKGDLVDFDFVTPIVSKFKDD